MEMTTAESLYADIISRESFSDYSQRNQTGQIRKKSAPSSIAWLVHRHCGGRSERCGVVITVGPSAARYIYGVPWRGAIDLSSHSWTPGSSAALSLVVDSPGGRPDLGENTGVPRRTRQTCSA